MKFLSRMVCAVLIGIITIAGTAGCSSQNTSSAQQQFGNRQGSPMQGGYSGQGWKRGGENSTNAASNSQGAGQAQPSGIQTGDSSSQTQILGKVKSIVGNEVELAIGTQSSASSALTLTGETKTLLIPVGLTLTGSGIGFATGGSAATGGNITAGGAMAGSTASAAGKTGNTTAAGTARTRIGAGTAGTGNAALVSTAKSSLTTAAAARTNDFSSITKGMVLRITQKMIDGTLTVFRVAIVSK